MIRIARVGDLEPGACKLVKVEGKELALCHVDGRYYAIDNSCPHQGGPLALGVLEGTALACPLHGWSFDVTTGAMPGNPKIRVGCFRVVVDGHDVLVDL